MAEGDDEKDQVIQELLQRAESAEAKSIQSSNVAMASSGMVSQDGNLVQYQLEVAEMLDKLENFYKGAREGYDPDSGNIVWKEQTDTDLIPLNEYGVNSMMEIVTKYIDKNTSLSYYSETRIMEILADLGDEMVLFIFCNYERMGMDTYAKKTKFRILIATTLHVIESTYRRAIMGRTSEEINQSKILMQTDNIGNRNFGQQIKKSASWKDPRSWV